jgi:hypothetical protein
MFFSEENLVNEKTAVETKQPYEAPVPLVYGDVRQITQAVGNMGASDNGMAPTHKTQ